MASDASIGRSILAKGKGEQVDIGATLDDAKDKLDKGAKKAQDLREADQRRQEENAELLSRVTTPIVRAINKVANWTKEVVESTREYSRQLSKYADAFEAELDTAIKRAPKGGTLRIPIRKVLTGNYPKMRHPSTAEVMSTTGFEKWHAVYLRVQAAAAERDMKLDMKFGPFDRHHKATGAKGNMSRDFILDGAIVGK